MLQIVDHSNVRLAMLIACVMTAISLHAHSPSYGAEATKRPELKVGEQAPDFTARTISGQTWKLSDFRGRYILIDFCAPWCGPCHVEAPLLKAVWDEFKDVTVSRREPSRSGMADGLASSSGSGGVVMLSFSLDKTIQPVNKFIKRHNLNWPHVFLASGNRDILNRYGIRAVPSVFLVGPDGKIVAWNLRGKAIRSTVAKHLAGKGTR